MKPIRKNPYSDDAEVSVMTNELMRRGHSTFQIFKMDADDKTHIDMMLAEFSPPMNARILDAGCGIGAISYRMSLVRPDLRFTLLNISKSQLDMCPDQFSKIHGDYHSIPCEANSFDAIMFNYSIGNVVIEQIMAEAARILRPDGVLFIYDMESESCDALTDALSYKAYSKNLVVRMATENGLITDIVKTPVVTTMEHMKGLLDVDMCNHIFKGVNPVIYKFSKPATINESIESIMDRHEKIALMYSGGKDSTACLYLLKKWWSKLHVVWVNSGAAFPEIVANMEEMKKKLPHFVEVKSNQPDYVEAFGHPCEVLPVNYTALGQAIGDKKSLKLNSYLDCCATNIWRPAMDAVHAIGATLLIRGQKDCDDKKSPIKSGQVFSGIEYFFPIVNWSHDRVRDYLREQDFITPSYYGLAASSLDCWNCTAYSYEHKDKLEYMKENHPDLHDKYKGKLCQIKDAVNSEMLPILNLVGE